MRYTAVRTKILHNYEVGDQNDPQPHNFLLGVAINIDAISYLSEYVYRPSRLYFCTASLTSCVSRISLSVGSLPIDQHILRPSLTPLFLIIYSLPAGFGELYQKILLLACQ